MIVKRHVHFHLRFCDFCMATFILGMKVITYVIRKVHRDNLATYLRVGLHYGGEVHRS